MESKISKSFIHDSSCRFSLDILGLLTMQPSSRSDGPASFYLHANEAEQKTLMILENILDKRFWTREGGIAIQNLDTYRKLPIKNIIMKTNFTYSISIHVYLVISIPLPYIYILYASAELFQCLFKHVQGLIMHPVALSVLVISLYLSILL